MRKITSLLFIFFTVITFTAQELNCLVTVNSDQIAGSNKQVFTTLQRALSEYINQTKWTDRTVKPEERIDCAMTIIITSRDNNNFTATLQVQSSRPVFNSSYPSPVLNIKDNEFNFKYNEFDPLIYNKNAFDSNLISTIVFYANIIIGVDADTFGKFAGDKELKEAQNVMLQAQQSGLSSWQNVVGQQNRYLLIDNLISPKLKAYRNILYNYHRNGLDNLVGAKASAQQSIEDSVIALESIYNKTVGNYLIRLFFDAKADEIVNLYSEDTKTRNKQRLIQTVRKISTNNNSKWRKLD
ncbi:type IX secretion system protein PorD [Polaribacter sp. OB-PA-B3]